jgi:predicted transposase/invertase (TIGR01784 family)
MAWMTTKKSLLLSKQSRNRKIAIFVFSCYNTIMPMDDVIIKPTSDLFIAALWSAPKNEPILRSLLNSVMTDIDMPPIVKAIVQNPYNIRKCAVDKQIRLDVRVEDETGAIYDVEVQANSHAKFFDRMLYYWAETYGSQITRGDDYGKLCPVRSIIITEFPVFLPLKQLHTVFEIRARENPAVLLSEHFQMHFLRLGNLSKDNISGLDQLVPDLQRWMQFWSLGSKLEESKMSTLLQDSPPVLAAYEEYKRFSADPVMREQAKERERFLIDLHLNRIDALEEGREKGLAEGEAKKARETAAIMKKKGYAVSEIAEMTGLPPSEIERL